MKTTTKLLVLAMAALFTLLINFGCADVVVDPEVNINGPGSTGDTEVKARESFFHIVDLTNQTLLKLKGINGTVDVQSVSGTNQVTISGEKIVSSDTYQDAYSQLKNITIEINELTDELQVKTVQPNFSDDRSYQVNYTITVPSHLNVFVDNVNGVINGKLTVPHNGSVEMGLINGSIVLDIPQNTSSDFFASLVNGAISLQNLTVYNRIMTSKSLQGRLGEGQGMITLRTINGTIVVSGY